ncbi:hyaluronidase PH-20-like isoform X3 [Scyliorhinus canicula]|uniref:hyaluronidase PH-20-like isoform X3 n=1 Tax=Scyliorhinus canicula TaxID=7830 RepID=UPI0018F3AC7C|nr:hyaluronidase PH-20-like isoform X3 [Scyliorhinus canicula]
MINYVTAQTRNLIVNSIEDGWNSFLLQSRNIENLFVLSGNGCYRAIMRLHGCISNPVSMAIIQLALLISTGFNQAQHQTVDPLMGNSPFSAMWNAPIELCDNKFGIIVDLNLFEIIGSPLETATGQPITIFYHNRLGYYPYYDELTKESFNGGIPQLAPLDLHYTKLAKDFRYYIPSKAGPGLAIINWENWRPQWIRNWDQKDIYRIKSVELVMQRNQSLDMNRATLIAKSEFEEQAKDLMLKTLKLGKSLRPNHLWGYYLYPECYNYHYKDKIINYTGSCPDIEITRNNELLWLWDESTALFPSIYLQTTLRDSVAAAKFVRHRVQEAKRVALLSSQEYTPPLYVYTRPVFTNAQDKFLSETDLVHTIGESAALGTAGFVIWGSLSMTETKSACLAIADYVKEILNPYIVNVTSAARLCSKILCQKKGRCVRKSWDSTHYLHLNPASFRIRRSDDGYTVIGRASFEDIVFMAEKFTCQCYTGQNCEPADDVVNYVTELDACIEPYNCVNLNPNTESSTKSNIIDPTNSTSANSTLATPSPNHACFVHGHLSSSSSLMFSVLYIMYQM